MKTQYTLWFNPKCSKCRETLQLLERHQVEPEIRRYLEKPPSPQEIESLLQKLGISPHALVRSKEESYRTLGLSSQSSREDLVRALASHPELLERPILEQGERAVIARPPERALELLA